VDVGQGRLLDKNNKFQGGGDERVGDIKIVF
jgi:hypothetical protein